VHVVPPLQARPQLPQFLASPVGSTQAPPHRSNGVLQAVAQWPPLQASGLAQGTAHAPQLAGSLCRSTHRPSHSVIPFEHTHTPPTHAVPPVQAFPQLPQFDGSAFGSTQLWPHRISSTAQVALQPPFEHDRSAAHGLPQLPQFSGSVLVFVQAPAHSAMAAGQPQWPFRQVEPLLQAMAQLPQWPGSAKRSRHAPAHAVNPALHESAQTPELHTGVPPEHV
jgi:hypothetical protein